MEMVDRTTMPIRIRIGDIPTNTDSAESRTRRTMTPTTEDMQKKKNDVKARTTLLLSLPDEHQLRFSKYKTARELWAAILKTFGGNEATKKKKKNLLKQQYGNFKAEGTETLEQTFNRLQVIVSQLQFMDVDIEKDDLNQKFLTSLAPEWLIHTISGAIFTAVASTFLLAVATFFAGSGKFFCQWELYNWQWECLITKDSISQCLYCITRFLILSFFEITQSEDMQKKKNDVKERTTLLLSLPDEHQLRFSKYKTARELWATILKTFGGNEATKKTKKNLLKQQYGNFKAEGSETLEQLFNRLQDTACAYIASHSSGSQIKFKDINQIDEDDMEEMDIK
nr:hypothetical protein [Tanacetum cinerariifolium]